MMTLSARSSRSSLVNGATGEQRYLHGLEVARIDKESRRIENLSFGQRRMFADRVYIVAIAPLSRQSVRSRRRL